MRIIKRYANRKLYDTTVRRYINLVEIADLVQGGAEVKVVDSKNGEDITKVTLSQILHDKEKKKQGFVPKTLFTNLIRKSGSSLIDYLKRSVKSGLGLVTWGQEEIDKGVKALIRAGEITEQEGRRLREDLVDRLLKNKGRFEKAIDERIQGMLHSLNIPAQKDITRLADKLELLATRVQALDGRKNGGATVRVKATVRRKGARPARASISPSSAGLKAAGVSRAAAKLS